MASDASNAQKIIDGLDCLLFLNDRNLVESREAGRMLQTRSKYCRQLVSLCEEHTILPTRMTLRDLHVFSHLPVAFGGYGTIYQAISNGQRVAAKVLRTLADDGGKARRRLHREVATWAQLRHERIQPLLGVAEGYFGGHLCMISPWCENGDVIEYLRVHTRTSALIRRLLKEIMEGLVYLHGEGLVHGDLRGRNVLIDNHGHARLTDFGLSGFVDATMPNSSFGGSVAWMSPEQLFPSKYGLDFPYPKYSAADVYSFGTVCIELYTGTSPFSCRNDAMLILQIINGARPPRPSPEQCSGLTLPDELWSLMANCWAEMADERPTSREVLMQLRLLE